MRQTVCRVGRQITPDHAASTVASPRKFSMISFACFFGNLPVTVEQIAEVEVYVGEEVPEPPVAFDLDRAMEEA